MPNISEEFFLTPNPDRLIMAVDGLSPTHARNIAMAAVKSAQRRMPKMSGASASRLQPVYGIGYFGIKWQDCFAPGTKVLRGDWNWVPVEELRAGDSLISFDEEVPEGDPGIRGRGRRYREGHVTDIFPALRKCVEVTFDDGFKSVCTESHPWLVKGPGGYKKRKWVLARDLTPGHTAGVYFEPWERETSFEGGWLAGMFDGEGSYAHSKNRYKSGEATTSRYLQITQNDGPILDRVKMLLKERHFDVYEGTNGHCSYLTIRGGFAEQMRLLGSIRPERLLPKVEYEGRHMTALRERRIVSVRDVGMQEVMVMGTTTQTYLADGMGAHNSYTWFQENGIRPFTMTKLQGKTIPMWIDDPTGMERAQNPKAKTRVTLSGKTQVLIFRRVAKIGDMKTSKRRIKGSKPPQFKVVSVPRHWPGAPGRIGRRYATVKNFAPPAGAEGPSGNIVRSLGQIASGNIGVWWRHPGLQPKFFLNAGMTEAIMKAGFLPERIYVADASTWKVRSPSYIARYGGDPGVPS